MKKILTGIIILALANTLAVAGEPRVFLLDAKRIQSTRQRLNDRDQSLGPALDQLKREADEALKQGPWSVMDKDRTPPSGDKHDYMSQAPYFWPNPDTPDHLPYIRKDGVRNPEIYKISDEQNISRLSENVQTLSLAYYLTSDDRYAMKAGELLHTWFIAPATRMNSNLQFAQGIPGINTGRGIGIIETATLTRVVDAIGLLEGSAAWSADDQRAMVQWFDEYLRWLQESKNGQDESASKNNHGTFYDLQVASFALFVGKDDVAKQVLQNVGARRIAAQIEPDGSQPLELARTKAWSYSIMNVRGLMLLAILGDRVGVDLWDFQTSDGRSIRKALDFLTPFSLGEKKWEHQQIDGFEPKMLHPLLRRSALKWPDVYQPIVVKLPPVEPSDRSILTGPTLITTNKRIQQQN